MDSNPMGPMPGGDPGDENDSKWQQCEQDIESLEDRVSAIEAKLGISSPPDTDDNAGPTKPPAAGMMGKAKGGMKPFFGGSY